MERDDVIRTLEEMAALLELSGAGAFEVMAYRNGARNLESWEGDLAGAARQGKLTGIRGIGKGLAGVIADLLLEGRSSEHERLQALVPRGVRDVLQVPGLGPKKVRTLRDELGIESLDDLECAARGERIRKLKGFGAKSEERILAALERRRERERRAREAPSEKRARDPASPGGSSPPAGATAPAGAAAAPTGATGRTTDGERGGKERHAGARGTLRLGTSGYSYREWKGTFFPEDLPATKFLSFYSGRFPTVEINNTFYRFPSEKTLVRWASETPESFLFALKANQRITHRALLRDVAETTSSFVRLCRGMHSRLGPILFQLPPHFRRDDDRLARFLEELPHGARYALEFRHESWFDDAVLRRLRDAGVALVHSDDEKLDVPRVVTADFVYIRLRRDEYADPDLESWRSWIRERLAEGRDVFCYLKHDEGGSSPEEVLGRLAE